MNDLTALDRAYIRHYSARDAYSELDSLGKLTQL